jgi:tetratricopeptide (TPR) repeat protein
VTPSGVAALSAASGKSPAEVALFLASQRGSWNRWGWGWGGWWGSPGWGFWGINPFGLVPWGFGPGFSVGFGYHSGPWAFGLGYNFGYSPVMPFAPVFVGPPVGVAEADPQVLPQPEPVPPAGEAARPAPSDFAQQGQELFLAGKYGDAVKALRHAVVDDPQNGPLLALTGEALWAAGSYNEAAGAIQQSLLATPEADWTGVAGRAARLIPAEAVGNLGKAIGEKESPDLRFLAAYQSFGAGKYDEAAAHLDLLLKKAPDDAVAKKLRDQAAKLAAGK